IGSIFSSKCGTSWRQTCLAAGAQSSRKVFFSGGISKPQLRFEQMSGEEIEGAKVLSLEWNSQVGFLYHRAVEKSNSASAVSPIRSRIASRSIQSCGIP